MLNVIVKSTKLVHKLILVISRKLLENITRNINSRTYLNFLSYIYSLFLIDMRSKYEY